MTNGKRDDLSPPSDRVTSGVRTGDTAMLPAPRPPAVGATGPLLEDVVVGHPQQPDAPSPEQSQGRLAAFKREMLDNMAELEQRLKESLDHTISKAVDIARTAMLEEADRTIDGRLGTFWKELWKLLDERLRNMVEQQESNIGRVQGDIGNVRKDLGGEISALRNDVSAKASREEVDSISDTIGSLRGDVAAFRESVEGLKGTDDARREALDALNQQVHGFVGKMETFEGRVGAFAKDTEEARGELETLRQADTNLNAEQTRLAARVRGIEQMLEELKGAFKGIRDEALPDVRKAAIRAEQAATAASAKVAELLPRLEYFGELAVEMRNLRSFMDRVAALERWRTRHSADIADIGERVGLNELAEELRGALPRK